MPLEYWFYPAIIIATVFASRIVWGLADKATKKLINNSEVCKYEEEIKAIIKRQEELREDKLPEIQKTIAILSERYEVIISKIDHLAAKLEKACDKLVEFNQKKMSGS